MLVGLCPPTWYVLDCDNYFIDPDTTGEDFVRNHESSTLDDILNHPDSNNIVVTSPDDACMAIVGSHGQYKDI
jgi:hypothetical protein